MPARPCADSAPTGSSIFLSIASTPSTTITPATRADDRRGPQLDVARRGRDGDQARRSRRCRPCRCRSSWSCRYIIGDGGDHARGGREVRDHRDLREAPVERVQAGARVEAEPAEPQDQHAEAEQRHVVARDRPRLAVGAVLAAARAEQQQRGERAGGADQVDHRRAGEVLHAELRGEPAAAEDPVGADRVDERREDDRVDDVDAELDALERRAPDDRQRDGAEDELEEPERLDRDRAVRRRRPAGSSRRRRRRPGRSRACR